MYPESIWPSVVLLILAGLAAALRDALDVAGAHLRRGGTSGAGIGARSLGIISSDPWRWECSLRILHTVFALSACGMGSGPVAARLVRVFEAWGGEDTAGALATGVAVVVLLAGYFLVGMLL
ncbi:MAG: hypothetical protein N3A38_11535, partial [Planctomycetota bacterium]|nr:hypothetical protein [Planctomycetota bacterium]